MAAPQSGSVLPPPGASASPVFLPPPPSDPPDEPTSGPSWVLVLLAAVAAVAIALGVVFFLSGRDDGGAPAGSLPPVSVEAGGDAVDDALRVDDTPTDAGVGAGTEAATAPGEDAAEPSAPDAGTPTPAAADPDATEPPASGDASTDPAPAEDDLTDPALPDGGPSEDDAPDASPPPDGSATLDESGDVDAAEVPAGEVSGDGADVDEADAQPVSDPVEESRAVVRQGQIYLEGAVPTQAAADEIEALAAEILGPDNVFNNYVIDERAGDPSLGNITVEDTINFQTGSAILLPEAEGLLNQGLALMTIRPAVTIEIVGHTDDRGSEEYNQELSEARAEAVKQWFVDRGVDPGRLVTSGAGESEPIADNATAEGRRLNRRIQLFLQNILGDA